MSAHEHDYVCTGNVVEGKHEYKCECGKVKLLESDPCEGIKEQPTVPRGTMDTEQVEADKKLLRKKKQSDYHKRRYQMMKGGEWTGSMKNAEQ